ncbi:hypothetical protein GGR54DRAFT_644315 [Hypoxylon sp. NC1633]|nr:hypothetical protein GGR54DRAFT_644315 [Hypoxylon sp. NC1633]
MENIRNIFRNLKSASNQQPLWSQDLNRRDRAQGRSFLEIGCKDVAPHSQQPSITQLQREMDVNMLGDCEDDSFNSMESDPQTGDEMCWEPSHAVTLPASVEIVMEDVEDMEDMELETLHEDRMITSPASTITFFNDPRSDPQSHCFFQRSQFNSRGPSLQTKDPQGTRDKRQDQQRTERTDVRDTSSSSDIKRNWHSKPRKSQYRTGRGRSSAAHRRFPR